MTTDTNPLQFNRIRIESSPGFETTGFAVDDLAGQVNIVHGPNGAGKTTFARCIQVLLWPGTARELDHLIGHFSLENEKWRASVRSGTVDYQRDGRDAERPSLPPSDQRDRYNLALHDLLQRDTDNASLARIIERESAGGYDLRSAAEELGYENKTISPRKKEAQQARKAVKNWENLQKEVRELRRNEQKLTELEQKLKTAREAERRTELLDRALDYHETRSELDRERNKLEQFPEVLSEANGNEHDRIEEIENDLEKWRKNREEARTKQKNARKKQAEQDLPEEGISDGTIEKLIELRERIHSQENTIENKTEKLEGAKERRKTAREKIGKHATDEQLREFDPIELDRVTEIIREAESLQARQETQEALKKLLDPGEIPNNLDQRRQTLNRGVQTLVQWLQARSPDEFEPSGRPFLFALLSSGAVTVLVLLLSFLVHPALLSLLLLPAGMAGYGWWALRTSVSSAEPPERESFRDRFETMDLPNPDDWNEQSVRNRIDELVSELQTLERHRKIRDFWQSRRTDEQEFEESQNELDRRRKQLRDEIGIAPDLDNPALHHLLGHLNRWAEAHEDVTEADRQLEQARSRLDEQLEQFNDETGEFGYEPISGTAGARKVITDLKNRKQNHEEARKDLKQAGKTLERAENEIASLREKQREIYTKLNLDTGEKSRVRKYMEQLTEYRDIRDRIRRKEGTLDNKEQQLRNHPQFEESLLDATEAELTQERQDARAMAEEKTSLRDRIQEIRRKIERAKEDEKIETAMAEKQRALGRLAEQLEADRQRMVGDRLVESLEEHAMQETRPAVFERARSLLAEFTAGRYRLLFGGEDEEPFRALDTNRDKGLSLGELSDGTRLQLLLAVRMAFVEEQEKNRSLPLLLDETLANTDDRTAGTIIDAVLNLAAAGRQVFYFTAQGDEVAKWHHALNTRNALDHQTIDLAKVRNLKTHVNVPDLSDLPVRTSTPPEPEETSHEQYRERLDIPPFQPETPPEQTHLWYLVEDVNLLYQLLTAGITRWGQLKTLLDTGRAGAWIDDERTRRKLVVYGEIIEQFVEEWRVGRGKPVPPEAILETDAVTETFEDEVLDLREQVNGRGRRIIEELRKGTVNRFQENKRKELEEYFKSEGYIDTSPTLEPSRIRTRIIAHLIQNDFVDDRETAVDHVETLLERLTQSNSDPGERSTD